MTLVAEDARALADDILSSARERQRTISERKSGVAERKSEVAEFLTTHEMERQREFRDTHDRTGGRVANLIAETRRFLWQCDAEQGAVAEKLRRAADELRGLAAESETARLEAFRQMREQIAQMHGEIARDVAELAARTRQVLSDFGAEQRALEDELQRAANELRQQLASGDNARLEAFCQLHERVAGRVAGLRREVRCKLEESHNDSLATRAVWNDLASARLSLGNRTRKN